VQGPAAVRILERVEELDPSLLVLGSHGRTGASRFLLGSVAERVVNQADCPVLVVKDEQAMAAVEGG
jgi:nucleotide-binding universal stress UspA family protein